MDNELQLCDIILFKADQNNWFEKAIVFLTSSDVSHSAMLFQKDTIIELIANGLCTNSLSISDGGNAYVMRLIDNPDITPVMSKCLQYLKANPAYNFPALVTLSIYFLYRKITPNNTLFKIGGILLMYAIKELDAFIYKNIENKEAKPMTCSQFVHQVYEDCGENYKIKIDYNHKKILNSSKEIPATNKICIADELNNYILTKDFDTFLPTNITYDMTEQDLIKDFCEALIQGNSESFDTNDTNNALFNILPNAYYFIKKIKEFLHMVNIDVPVSSLFVAPGDFLNYTKNLYLVKEINISRIY